MIKLLETSMKTDTHIVVFINFGVLSIEDLTYLMDIHWTHDSLKENFPPVEAALHSSFLFPTAP